SDGVEKAPVKKEDMLEKITQYIFEMRNANIQRLTRHVSNKHQNEFVEYPAATKKQQEFLSGLAYEDGSILDLAKANSNLYQSLDKELL
ncbi:3'-5' exonuclease, partial [Bacillus thuringiensis]|nr:3'-5' exonuclease [Bacillus thuringiensis]